MKNFSIFCTLVLLVSSCNTPENTILPTQKILVGSGPEDMVIDRKSGEPRLLISCTARREGENPFGEIVCYTPKTGLVDTMLRIGTPDSLFFQPHGIFLDSISKPQKLFAISHEHDIGFHPVYVWEIHGDSLVYLELACSKLLHSPNALTLGKNEEIYIVNDSGKRGSIIEKALKLNRADLVKLVKLGKNQWEGEIVADRLGYPAGINRLGDTLYVGDAVNHQLHRYRIHTNKLDPISPVKGLRGNDNIRIIKGMLLITGHVKPFKFIAHTKSSDNHSPVKVWKVNPESEEITKLFYTDGSLISAGSTALIIQDTLFISQVFDPYILRVELQGNK